MVLHRSPWVSRLLALAIVLWLALAPGLSVAAAAPTPPAGTYYVVRYGDSWSSIAWRNGLTIAQLRAANPTIQHPGLALWPGDRLFIPTSEAGASAPEATAQPPTGPGYWYILKAGDTWLSIARDTGVDILDLYHANPALVARDRYLYPGQQVWIPGTEPTPPETTPSPTPAPPPTLLPVAPPSPTPLTRTPVPAAPSAGCPAQLAAYPAAITGYLNGPDADVAGLRTWLTRCGAINQLLGGVTEGHIQAKDTNDVVVVLYDPADRRLVPAARLLVYHDTPAGYVLAGVAQGDGRIAVLKVDDINADGLTDIVWTDTTCNTTACYSTLFVDSWDGTAYRSYIDGQPTTPNADYSFQPVPGSLAQAITVRSRTPGAGDQSVTYLSTAGGPYRPAGQGRPGLGPAATAAVTSTAPVATGSVATGSVATGSVATGSVATASPFPVTPAAPAPPATGPATAGPATAAALPPTVAPAAAGAAAAATPTPVAAAAPQPAPTATAASACLYDRVRSANQSFDAWMTQGFATSIDAYQAIIADTTSKACGTSPDELSLLRDFARFRLIVASIASGKGGIANATRTQMTIPALQGAADAFLNSYTDSHSVIQACRDATTYAASHPASYQFLIDLGSKDFTAADLCPLAK